MRAPKTVRGVAPYSYPTEISRLQPPRPRFCCKNLAPRLVIPHATVPCSFYLSPLYASLSSGYGLSQLLLQIMHLALSAVECMDVILIYVSNVAVLSLRSADYGSIYSNHQRDDKVSFRAVSLIQSREDYPKCMSIMGVHLSKKGEHVRDQIHSKG